MEFKSVSIKNFRNFKDIEISLSNRNVFFGLNDVGKTNFLYALRYVLDRDVRKENVLDSDYYRKDVSNPIEIVIEVDISDKKCVDNEKLRARLKGSIMSGDNQVYIKFMVEYDNNEMTGITSLYWGGDLDRLMEMKSRGYFYEIDYVFNIVYVDSYVDLNKLFKRNTKLLINNSDSEDEKKLEEISTIIEAMNMKISSLSGIKKFETEITEEYKKFRDESVAITVKSELAIKGLYSNVVPYIKSDEEELLYPTSGEGRRKLLTYSIFDLISKEQETEKINIFLIEEPENHLHMSIQIALSRVIFNEDVYKYFFITTHSPYILKEMDNLNLVRVYNSTKIDTKSSLYTVPDEFKHNRKLLNSKLTEALFADRVLLVEGPSEEHLFHKVLSTIDPLYEIKGIYILPVNGIGFEKYYVILEELGIRNIVKTDNDLRKVSKTNNYSVLGFSRVNGFFEDEELKLPTDRVSSNSVDEKIRLYNDNIELLNKIRDKYDIHLSKCDLENDLYECLSERLKQYLNVENPIECLQSSKHHNMVKLTESLSKEDCIEICNHYNFACLKEINE